MTTTELAEVIEPPKPRKMSDAAIAMVDSGPGIDAAATTVLLVRTRTPDAAPIASWDFPADPAVVRTARHRAARQLREWGLDHLVPDTELIVSELVTNAVRHGVGPLRLRLIKHQVLTCEVFDSGSGHPRLRHARGVDGNGRGLFMIAQLCHRWGFRSATGGKLVWVDQDLPRAPSDPYPRRPPPHARLP